VEEAGVSCQVGIGAATYEYYFEGEALVMLFEGEELRLSR
jgi:hypothetical protein